ncbi:hypothetical protein [Rhizobium sp. 1399]|jgi:hypothetical protein|uniref:hypothetical protein n=1 Tax=Rhizobium sp. 1399 TaxID=2817758 RepID=UPI0028586B50|nr:hypothetical protein [Rhizobium sp. 1399]MDR6667670.1 hypothetical protein [Rhizobium sp. 1399]
MKIVKTGEDAFRMEMDKTDARESQIESSIRTITSMLTYIQEHGFSPEVRAQDRAGYWRYAEVERSLGLIRDAAVTALLHIKFLDFPEDGRPPDRSGVQ